MSSVCDKHGTPQYVPDGETCPYCAPPAPDGHATRVAASIAFVNDCYKELHSETLEGALPALTIISRLDDPGIRQRTDDGP